MFTDVFMDATKPKMINIAFTAGSEDPNDTNSMKIPNWPSVDDSSNSVTSLMMLQ
jgi:hypothetical protein